MVELGDRWDSGAGECCGGGMVVVLGECWGGGAVVVLGEWVGWVAARQVVLG